MNGIPAVRRCADTILLAGLRDVVVVTGAHGDAVEEAIRGLPVRIVRSEDPRAEMIASVRLGLQAACADSPAVLLCLADHPLVLPGTIRALVQAHDADPGSIVIPLHRGKRGHPTLFPRPLIGAVLAGRTLRDVIRSHADRILPIAVDDVGVVLDIDTQADYDEAGRILSDRC